MNASFDPFGLVNTYGAFGSVGRVRHEVVLEGTLSDGSRRARGLARVRVSLQAWRRPAARPASSRRITTDSTGSSGLRRFPTSRESPGSCTSPTSFSRAIAAIEPLLAHDPFPRRPPRYVRALLYRYRFAPLGARGVYWERELEGEYLRPLSLEHPEFRRFLASSRLARRRPRWIELAQYTPQIAAASWHASPAVPIVVSEPIAEPFA